MFFYREYYFLLDENNIITEFIKIWTDNNFEQCHTEIWVKAVRLNQLKQNEK